MKIKTRRCLKRYAKEIYTDDDGIWVFLKDKYVTAGGGRVIYGDTVQEVLGAAQGIKKWGPNR